MTFIKDIASPILLSMFANYGTEKVKDIGQKLNLNNDVINEIILESFLECIKQDKKYTVSQTYKENLTKLENEITKNKTKFFVLIDYITGSVEINFFNALKEDTYKDEFLDKLYEIYGLTIPEKQNDTLITLHEDLLRNFKSNFLKKTTNNVSEKMIIEEVLKLDDIVKILDKINVKVDEFDTIKDTILSSYVESNLAFKKTREEYDNYIINKFRYLELAGFSPKISGKNIYMKLMDVFIPLDVNYHETDFKQLKVQIHESNTEDYDEKKFEMITELLSSDGLVVLGDPGSGKSTLLKFISVFIATKRKELGIYNHLLPVFIKIADYSEYYKKERKSIYDFFINDPQYSSLFVENFEYSNILFLLDGLDEITDTSIRNKVVSNIIDLKSRYPKNKYIVTSRIIGYKESSLGGHFIESKVVDFSKNDIKQFAQQWYHSIGEGEIEEHKGLTLEEKQKIQDTYHKLATDLYKSISRNSSVIKFATNPLLMTIVAMIYFKSKKLPNKRVELYDIATETFLDNWVRVRFEENTKIKDKGSVLELLPHIAFEMHSESSKGLISETKFREEFIKLYMDIYDAKQQEASNEFKDFKEFLEKYAGFFHRKDLEGDNYGFVHLTFEEYLCALEFSSRWDMNELKVQDYIFLSRWIEVIRLSVANLKISHKGKSGRVKATKFIQEILDADNDFFPEAYRPFQLALIILVDDVEVESKLKNDLISFFINILNSYQNEMLLESFSELFGEMLESIYKEDFITKIFEELKKNNLIFQINIFKILNENFDDDNDVQNILVWLMEDNNFLESLLETYQKNSFFINRTILKNVKFQRHLTKTILQNNTLLNLKDLFPLYIRSKLSSSKYYDFFYNENDYEELVQIFNKTDKNSILRKLFCKFFLLKAMESFSGQYFTNNVISKIDNSDLQNKILKLKDMFVEEDDGISIDYESRYILYFHLDSGKRIIIDTEEILKFEFDKNSNMEDIINTLPEKRYSADEILKLRTIITSLLEPEQCYDIKNFLSSFSEYRILLILGWTNVILKEASKTEAIRRQYIHLGFLNNLFFLNSADNETRKSVIKEDFFSELQPAIQISVLKGLNMDIDLQLIKNCIEHHAQVKDSIEKAEIYKLLYTLLNPISISNSWM